MTTFERVSEILIGQLGVTEGEITDESRLTDDLGADSLDCVETIMALEQEFNLDIADEDAEPVRTVADVVALVDRLKAQP